MNRSILSLNCIFLLVLVGCYTGDPSAARIVSLKVPVSEGQNKVGIFVDDANVREALTLIDGVLVSSGLTHIAGSGTPNPDGTIVRYQGPPTRGCGVSLRGDKLEVVFLEVGRQRSTEPVKEITRSLEQELKKHFGAERVRVVTAN